MILIYIWHISMYIKGIWYTFPWYLVMLNIISYTWPFAYLLGMYLLKINFIYLFIFGYDRSSFAVPRLSLVVVSRGYSLLWYAGFSLKWLLLLWGTGYSHAGFCNCNPWALLLCGMWDLSGPGIELCVCCIARWTCNHWSTRETLEYIFHSVEL